jgi:parvulin-like peptidyl-prolyl isomerase
MAKLFLTFFVLSLISFNSAFSQQNVAAEVNGTKITKDQLEEAYKQNMMFVSDKLVSKEKVLQDMINRELGVQRAKSNKLQEDPIVRYKLDDILYHAQISKDLENKLAELRVSDGEVKDYYKTHPEFRTAHILFRIRIENDQNEVNAALETAMKVYNTAKSKPDKFPEMAAQMSQTNTAAAGGDVGFQPAVRLAPEYFNSIKGKTPGYITPPVRTQFGYHVIKILGVKDYSDIDMTLYKKIVYDQKRDKIIDEYFRNIRSTAQIKINKETL